MTRKLFLILVIISALLISFSLVLAAKKAPHRGKPEVFVKPTIANKQQTTPMPRGALSEKRDAISIFPEQPPQSSVNIGLLSPGIKIYAAPVEYIKDFCDLYGTPVYAITDWFNDHSTHGNYQDPGEFGCTDVWPFQITEVGFDIQVDSAMDIDVQGFVVEADFTYPDCPTPGFLRCQTPVYTVSLPSGGRWIVSLPFDVECCMHGPYFAAVCIWSYLSEAGAHAVAEDDPTDVCRSYVPTADGWTDLVTDFGWPGEILLWSTGYTNPQNTCGSGPSDQCHLQRDNGTAASYFDSWEAGDQQAAYFDPATMCTECTEVYPLNITSVEGAFYDFWGANWVDVIFHFYEAGDICNGPGAEIYSFPATITTFYPDVAVVYTPEPVCLEDDFFLACEYNSGMPGEVPSLLFDNNPPVDTCIQWNEYSDYGWFEWWDFWGSPGDVGWIMMRAVGTCNDQACYLGEECDMMQGSGVSASYFGSWNAQDKVAKYYDPDEFCVPPVYPYRISDVEVALYDHAGVGSADINVRIYIECQQPCDGPGTEIYSSGPMTIDTFYPSLTHIDLPDLVCIYEPFFVAIEYASGITGEIPSVLFDDGSVPMDTCHAWVWYDGYSPPWWEWSDFWSPPPPGTPMIYVSGYTESPACDIPPCDTTLEMLAGGLFAYYYWKQPPNDEFINMRFEMPLDHGGRLECFEVGFYEGGSDGTPDPDFHVWLSDGLYPLDNNAPYQAVADFHITYDDIVWYPGWITIQTYAHNLIFDPGEMFHIGASHAFEPGDTLAHLSDDGSFESDRASAWDGSAWVSFYPYEFKIFAYICPIPWQPTFTMQCAPALGYATPGDPPANVYQVELTPILGYSENVTLSLLSIDPPANINATFTPNGLPPPYIADVAITVDVGVPYGDYTLTFQGLGGDAQIKTCDVTLRVEPPFDEVMVDFFHGSQRTSNFGAVGNDVRDNFVWYGTNYLFDGTIISAIPTNYQNQEGHMAFDVYDCVHLGFIPTQHLVKTYDPWCPGSSYEEYYGEVAYSNFYTEEDVISCEYDSVFVIGLKDVECVDFSIKIKIYYNPTDIPIPELWAGVFEDWDIGDAYNNWGDMDPDHNNMWMYDVADPAIVFGIMKCPFYDDPMNSMVFVYNPQEVYPGAPFCFQCGNLPGPAYLYSLMVNDLHFGPPGGFRYPGHFAPGDPDDYSTLIVGQPFALNPGDKHIEIWIDYGRNLDDGLTWGQWYHKILRYVGFYRGDVNASDTLELPALDVSDLIYLINYLYKGGPPPEPFADQGDVDGRPVPKDIDCPKNNVNVGDIVYLINYVWKEGPPPVDHVRFIPQYWSRPSLFTDPNW